MYGIPMATLSHSSRLDDMRLITAAALLIVAPLGAQAPGDTTWTRTQVMIPMRDGVHLSTVILAPPHAARLPMLMERTPYGVDGPIDFKEVAEEYADLVRDGYIFVWQDIRGRYQSEGSFVMNRPQHHDANGVDESTDTYDTIEWLVHHVPGTNGRVGIMGVSYPGWPIRRSKPSAHKRQWATRGWATTSFTKGHSGSRTEPSMRGTWKRPKTGQ